MYLILSKHNMIRELTNLMKFINNGTQVFDYSNNIIYSDMKGLLSKKQDDETTAEEFWNLNSNRFPGFFEIFKTFQRAPAFRTQSERVFSRTITKSGLGSQKSNGNTLS